MLGKRVDDATVVVGSPAKVNLYLEVLNRRDDGYHNINSLFQAVSLFDRLRVTLAGTPGVTIAVTGTAPDRTSVPGDERNLVARAYQLIRSECQLSLGIHVELEKNIPVAGGLAGGSSNAAAVMLALNSLFDLGLDYPQLASLGAQIGSDIPFFFSSGQALVTGRGERIEPSTFPIDYWLVLVTPLVAFGTAEAYASLKRDLTNSKRAFSLPPCQTVDELLVALSHTGNDFEEAPLASHPELGKIREGLLRCGARLVRMSGSGPTLFGMFDAPPVIDENGDLSRGDWRISTVWPITLPTPNAS